MSTTKSTTKEKSIEEEITEITLASVTPFITHLSALMLITKRILNNINNANLIAEINSFILENGMDTPERRELVDNAYNGLLDKVPLDDVGAIRALLENIHVQIGRHGAIIHVGKEIANVKIDDAYAETITGFSSKININVKEMFKNGITYDALVDAVADVYQTSADKLIEQSTACLTADTDSDDKKTAEVDTGDDSNVILDAIDREIAELKTKDKKSKLNKKEKKLLKRLKKDKKTLKTNAGNGGGSGSSSITTEDIVVTVLTVGTVALLAYGAFKLYCHYNSGDDIVVIED